ncbi:MAG: hypothetical protein WC764_04265 [Candidatus Paceibacterota bacterium]
MKKWRATLTIKYKQRILGYSESKIEAREMYAKGLEKFVGEFARG